MNKLLKILCFCGLFCLCDCCIIKLPPRLVLTIKGRNYHQTFFICDNYIKDDKRKIYRCKKNIEKELKKMIEE